MFDDYISEKDDELTRYQCPHCGKPFDVAGSKWENPDLVCPYCGGEIER
ncbi:MAG: zinc ribbon domain-containing protein [Candidatus Omnitrophota bacterium]